MTRDADAGHRDCGQLARSLVGQVTGQDGAEPVKESPYAAIGHKARAETLTAAERVAIASQGGHARWEQPLV